MIDILKGQLSAKAPTHLIVEVGGVGFRVLIPLSTYEELPSEGPVRLHTHLHVQEDALRLYGFATAGERDCFRLLIGISGVGPATAIGILSGCTVAQFRAAITTADDRLLRKIKGVGPKTAQRLILELKDSVALRSISGTARTPASSADLAVQDAVLALISLGYASSAAEQVVRTALASLPANAPVGDIVKKALQGK